MNDNCLLMHGDIPVAEISFHPTGRLASIIEIFDEEHMPMGHMGKDTIELTKWWARRSIPITRKGIRDIIDHLDIPSPEWMMLISFGLSLSDSYWIRPKNEKMEWKDVNLYDNPFSEDIGKSLFHGKMSKFTDTISPDLSTNGNLKKRWTINKKNRRLIKAGNSTSRQEPFNEVIASGICDRLNIKHVDYHLIYDGKEPSCICDAFTSKGNELIPLIDIYHSTAMKKGESPYLHLLHALSMVGAEGAEDYLDKTIMLDYIIANEDRHLGNMGILRDPQSLEFKGFAPIYDSGSSLCFDAPLSWIREGLEPGCKPFMPSHSEQIKLVNNFDVIDPDALYDVESFIIKTSSESKGLINNDRSNAISGYVRRRIDNLRHIIRSSGQ